MRPRAPQVGDTSEHLPKIMAGARLPCVVVACVMPGVRVFDYPTTIRFSYPSSVLLIEVYIWYTFFWRKWILGDGAP